MGLRKLQRRRSTQAGGSRQGGSFDRTVKRRQRSTRQELKWKYRARVYVNVIDFFRASIKRSCLWPTTNTAVFRTRSRLFRFISHPFPILLSGVFLSHKIGANFIPDSAVED
jgi:hypothetical protein